MLNDIVKSEEKSQVVCTIWPYDTYYDPVKEWLSDFDRDKEFQGVVCPHFSDKIGNSPIFKSHVLHYTGMLFFLSLVWLQYYIQIYKLSTLTSGQQNTGCDQILNQTSVCSHSQTTERQD